MQDSEVCILLFNVSTICSPGFCLRPRVRGVAYSQELKALASQALPFSTDEDGVDSSGMNPLASVFDLGKEPMDFWEDRVRG